MTNRKKKALVVCTGILAGAAVLLFATACVQLYQQRKQTEAEIAARYESGAGAPEQLAASAAGQEETAAQAAVSAAAIEQLPPMFAEKEVSYGEKEYYRNSSVKAYLIMGVDRAGGLAEEQVTGDGGQADGVFLVAHDQANNSVKLLQIPRDTMTPIVLTDLSGNVLGKDVQHLTLAYAYGDGRHQSCEYMRDAVSELLGGLDIAGYMSVSTDAISVLNDMIGGVSVTIETDDLTAADPAFVKGETVTLQGKQAERFVRYRDITEDNTALTRMDRQKQYIKAFEQKLMAASAKDSALVPHMFDSIQSYMVTDMQKGEYLRLAMDALAGDPLADEDFLLLPGEAVLTDMFDEYHPHADAIAEMVLELFYREK